jgi:hypothetical protein
MWRACSRGAASRRRTDVVGARRANGWEAFRESRPPLRSPMVGDKHGMVIVMDGACFPAAITGQLCIGH